MFHRQLNLKHILKRKSLFLLGPRQTGKSTYLKSNYNEAYIFDLLRPNEFLRLKTQHSYFAEEVQYQVEKNNKKIFIVDEIQKIPELLDEVHYLIEKNKNIRFILSGSSARKLKKTGVNLLGGRASRIYFHPIVSKEYGIPAYCKDLTHNLTYGFLPSILTSSDPWSDLEDYVSLYLKEEIQQETIVRNLSGFSRFLNTVAMTNAQQINFTGLGQDAQVPARTVREYYQVLEDTLIGNILPAFEKTKKRKAVSTAKFYLFDPGVTNFLLGRKAISPRTAEFGTLLEQCLYGEIKAYLDYHRIHESLFYWRSTSQFEVDFLIKNLSDEWIGIEIKSSPNPHLKDFKGLLALEEDLPLKRKIVACLASKPRLSEENVEILPLQHFLEQLWSGELLG